MAHIFTPLFQITSLEPIITGLREALPKSIGLLPFDGGLTGKSCKMIVLYNCVFYLLSFLFLVF